jgi:hypothetical protein
MMAATGIPPFLDDQVLTAGVDTFEQIGKMAARFGRPDRG